LRSGRRMVRSRGIELAHARCLCKSPLARLPHAGFRPISKKKSRQPPLAPRLPCSSLAVLARSAKKNSYNFGTYESHGHRAPPAPAARAIHASRPNRHERQDWPSIRIAQAASGPQPTLDCTLSPAEKRLFAAYPKEIRPQKVLAEPPSTCTRNRLE
jgi:hypothetical protein